MKGGWLPGLMLAAVLAWTGPVHAQDPAPAAAEAQAEQPLGEEEAMVLNFERADIREVIHSLATALGISYTIDPRIEGQVTIRTTGKIAREDLFPLLNQILRNNGIAAVKVGDIYQILPVAEAKTRAIVPNEPTVRQRSKVNDEFVIEILPVKHVSSDEMVNVLQPFVTPGGDALSYPRGNLVVVTDLESNVRRLRELVQTFDSNVFRDLHTRVFKMKEGDPEELANELLGVLAPYGVTATGEGEGGVYVVPLSRLNSLIVVAYDVAIFDEVERWLKLLDIPPEEGAGRQTFVYPVENAKAVDLADVLNELFGGGAGGGVGGLGRNPGGTPAGVGLFGAGGVSGGGGGGRLGSGRRGGIGGGVGGAAGQQAGGLGQQAGGAGGLGGGGSGVSGGSRRLGGRGGGLGGGTGAGGGVPGQAGGGARGVSLPGGPAGVPGAPGQQQGPPPIFKEEVRIVADEVTNSLVILATKRDYQLILDVLRRIDVTPRQVLLEVTIAEIKLTKELQFGVAWAVTEGKLISSTPEVDNVFHNRPEAGPVGGLFPNTARFPDAAFAVLTDRNHFNVLISALQSRTNVKMLSAPHIIAADNREAHILVGDSVPILTSVQQTLVTQNNTVLNSVQYRDTGKILTILPQVNSKGLVNMQVRQEVSAVGNPNFGATGSPSFSTREAETTVVVQDGESVVIGGIIDDTISHNRSGIPYLMDIPVLGRAFRTESDSNDRTELIVLITPYVVRSRDDAREVTDIFTTRLEGIRNLRTRMTNRGLKRMPQLEQPAEVTGELGVRRSPPIPPMAPTPPPSPVPPEAAP